MKQMKDHSKLIKQGFLEVSKIHKVFYKIFGNKSGEPVFIIHGGPGGTSFYKQTKLFDLDKYMLIFMDQRGTGKSVPFLETKDNNTDELVQDIEKMRKFLNLDKITLFGGSWGSTLSLLYAIKYPENIKQLVLRGVFLARQEDVDYLYEEGASYFYPDIFEKYKDCVKEIEGKNILEKYYNIFYKKTSNSIEDAVYNFSNWESSIVKINPNKPNNKITKNDFSIAFLETYYFYNKSFLKSDNYILQNIDKIKNIPTFIVHGRQDIDTPPIGAYLLNKELNNSSLFLISGAAHSVSEKRIWAKLKEIFDNLIYKN
ncbi:prolyl aminopeptidase [Mycoplasma leonicaptivi]|uniref:prolyl aminopeptidase n=1 Tax=Mycoplasma leonicaptivi TaxID=36742 RepID=UPI001FE060BE|nr:prolyl aminopeptidase [Mycoplasma leonicaptivi]